jgi:cell division protein FtsI/penicillin-binding protein 2
MFNEKARSAKANLSANQRISVWYGVLLFVFVVFTARLFYLQVIRHDYYHAAALNDQLKQYTIPAERGTISAHSDTGTMPIVLNQTLYTLYVDPSLIRDPSSTASEVAAITHGDSGHYAELMKTPNSRYQVLSKRLSEQQKNHLKDLVKAKHITGVGWQAIDYRIYPQGSLAANLLGFVNDDGEGKYGLEQALNKQLAGTPGELKAITDVNGVPLAASRDNVQIDPKPGEDVVLTINVALQKRLEDTLKVWLQRVKSQSGSVVITDPSNGAVKAMASWPTYNPAEYYKVSDANDFNNLAVSTPLEVGSIMKPLTTAAALNLGVISPDTAYYDPNFWQLDGHKVTNVEEAGPAGTRDIATILDKSVNTGATWLLMQMGGKTGEVNKQARQRWHDYLVNHYRFGKATGIEQGYEATGYVPDPDKGFALQLTYANTAFGQAMTATPLQMAAALSSVINGGTYYQPHLIDQTLDSSGNATNKKPLVLRQNVVSAKVGEQVKSLMEYVISSHFKNGFSYLNFPDNYIVGGKTGTAQIASPSGGYYNDRYNGTYTGFVGGDKPQYVVSIEVNQPHVAGYAGTSAGQAMFADIAHMLIDDFNVTPKSH